MKEEDHEMKRNMDLVRLILLEIENIYQSTAIYNLTIDGYDAEMIAYHCKIIHEAGLISEYKAQYADNKLYGFGVGSLTWDGNDFLDKIRDDSQWKKVKDAITKEGMPLVIETIKSVANAFISATVAGITTSILKG